MSFVIQASGASAPPQAPQGRLRGGSPQQEAFWAELAGGASHVLLEARAGTGKSTSCAEAMHRLDRRLKLTYCAFNKSIAADFQARAPSHCRASTMHSVGFGAIRAALGEVVVNNFKSHDLAEKYFPDKWKDKESRYAAAKLVSLCKANLADPEDLEGLADLAGSHGVDLGADREDILAVVCELLRESRETTSVIDYDDMIWLPLVLGLALPASDVLFVDEAQDLNPVQQALAFRLCPDGRIVVVGDPRQSIYAFRGADADSIPNMAAKLGATPRGLARLPLTVTWRCPASHVRLANALVPDLEAAPAAAEGDVFSIEEADALRGLKPGVMALCRSNAPLVSACYRLLREGTRAVVRGRDVGKGLLTLVAKLRARSVGHLVEKLDDYAVAERAKLTKLRHPGPALLVLEDKVACLMAMTDGAATVDELKARIETLFSDDDEAHAVVLSSIHKAKGLEREEIVILKPDQLPHKMALTDAERLQEANLAYVAATRSKSVLTFAGPIPVILGGN